jgi:hypothetical protein
MFPTSTAIRVTGGSQGKAWSADEEVGGENAGSRHKITQLVPSLMPA